MKPYVNPVFLAKLIKSYLQDVNRVWHMSLADLRRYQNKQLKAMIRYAYTVPLYHQKYKDAGIHPNDITTVEDIKKLPIVTKDDLRMNFPDGIIPTDFQKDQGFLLSTSGSTGKPVFVYCDAMGAIRRLEAFVRTLKAYGGTWNTSKTCLIIDDDPQSVEYTTFTGSLIPFLQRFFPLKNIKYLPLTKKPEDVMDELNRFQPEFLSSDPDMLRKLATLKNKGMGKKITPNMVFSGGAMLDQYTRKYVEHAFACPLRDIYGTTEAGPIAFECIEGEYYHVHSDLVLLEILDDHYTQVSSGTPGHPVITQLYGHGTPIIRYTGIEDIIATFHGTTHCGITTDLIHPIQGRKTDVFTFADGSTMSPLQVTGIPAKTMEKHDTYIIRQFQIIQHTHTEIEVVLVIDPQLGEKKSSVQQLLKELQQEFTEHIGHGVTVTITQTKEIEPEKRSDYVQVAKSFVKPPSVRKNT